MSQAEKGPLPTSKEGISLAFTLTLVQTRTQQHNMTFDTDSECVQPLNYKHFLANIELPCCWLKFPCAGVL